MVVRFINFQQDALIFTDLMPVEQISKKFLSCFEVLESGTITDNIKNAPTFNSFKRVIKPFLRARQDTT